MKVCVVGFGPAGCVMAVALRKNGHIVKIYEKDINPFDVDLDTLKQRSYPVVLPPHGSQVLQSLNMIHHFDGSKYLNRLHSTENQNISRAFSGSRLAFMKAFLEAISKECPLVDINFNTPVTDVNVEINEITVNGRKEYYDLIIGADGVGSIVRQSVVKYRDVLDIERRSFDQYFKTLWMDKNVDPAQAQFIKEFSPVPFFIACYVAELENKAMMSAIVGKNQFETAQQARAYLNKVSKEASSHVSEQELANFINQKPLYAGRFLYAKGQYYYGTKIVLVGDSVHTYPPSGQGITLAITGALNLSQRFNFIQIIQPMLLRSTHGSTNLKLKACKYQPHLTS